MATSASWPHGKSLSPQVEVVIRAHPLGENLSRVGLLVVSVTGTMPSPKVSGRVLGRRFALSISGSVFRRLYRACESRFGHYLPFANGRFRAVQIGQGQPRVVGAFFGEAHILSN